jgi:hypothetical protein
MKGPGDLSSCERAEPRGSSQAEPRAILSRLGAPGLLAAAIGLAGCQSGDGISRTGTDPVSLDRVIVLNDSICGPTRPDFAGAKARMVAEGLTVEEGGRNFSPTSAVSAAVTRTPEGRTFCAVSARFPGNVYTLEQAMAERFGAPRMTDRITPPARVYNLGAKGNLILVIRGTPGRTLTAYDLGYATGI